MRFSEILVLTPKDFDFAHQNLSVSKTWDYKGDCGFQPTKNKSSSRKIQIDWQTVTQFSGVSIASVARRLGHASMTTTQKTYLHIIQELENKTKLEAQKSPANTELFAVICGT